MDRIIEALAALRAGRSYALFDLDLGSDELDHLRSIRVRCDGERSWLGPISSVEAEVTAFLAEMTDAPAKAVGVAGDVVRRVGEAAARCLGKDHVYGIIRTFGVYAPFCPRWHQDGWYFSGESRGLDEVKIVLPLVGRGTLFYHLEGPWRPEFQRLSLMMAEKHGELFRLQGAGIVDLFDQVLVGNLESEIAELRAALAALLNWSVADAPNVGQAAMYIVADESRAAIHSEPPFDVPRVFLSLLAGTEEEVRGRAGVS